MNLLIFTEHCKDQTYSIDVFDIKSSADVTTVLKGKTFEVMFKIFETFVKRFSDREGFCVFRRIGVDGVAHDLSVKPLSRTSGVFTET
jgi:hypothetical protein